ncbi:MAG: beta-ketoacyl reductase, partial [Cyanobacteria bacterium J06649_11]
GNHVAANTFLDTLAKYRQSLGLPGLSINWGVWSEIGTAAKLGVGQQMQLRGVGEITNDKGLNIFEKLLAQYSPQVGVIPVDCDKFLQQNISSPFFTDFINSNSKSQLPKQESELLQKLKKANIGDRTSIVMGHLQAEVGKVLALASNQLPGLQQGFFDLGMDSLMTVELRNRLETSLGISIPSTVIFEYPTIADLAEYLVAQVSNVETLYITSPEIKSPNTTSPSHQETQKISTPSPPSNPSPPSSDDEAEIIDELAALESLLGKDKNE